MATIQKLPDRYRVGSSLDDALGGEYTKYRQVTNFTVSTSPKQYLMFQYQLATTEITSGSFQFHFSSNNDGGTGNAKFVITAYNKAGVMQQQEILYIPGHASGYYGVTFPIIRNVDTLYVLVLYTEGDNTFNIHPYVCRVEGTQPELSGHAARNFYVGSDGTLSILNRCNADVEVTIAVEYKYGVSEIGVIYTTVQDDTYSFVPSESWFVRGLNTTGSIRVIFTFEDTAGRFWTDSNYFLIRSMPQISFAKASVGVDEQQTITVTDPYNRIHDITLSVKTVFSREEESSATTYQYSLPESVFVEQTTRGQSIRITVGIKDASSSGYNRSASASYTLTRQGIGVAVLAHEDQETDPATIYANTGETFSLRFTDRWDRALTIQFKANSRYLKNSTGDSSSWTAESDQALFDCLKRWFEDAAAYTAASLHVSATVSDAMLRETTVSFEVRAGSDMSPLVAVATSSQQPSPWPSELAASYVQGYTRAKFVATVTAQSSAQISSVSLSSPQIGVLQLAMNTVTGDYEAETQAPLTADTVYTITAVDQRGLVTTTQAATLSVLPYSVPSITVDSYHRCRDDRTPDDSGSYCEMVVSFAFSALQDLNGKDTAVVTTGVQDERTLAAYTSRETYFFAVDPDHSYQIVISATDLLYSVSKTVVLSTAGVIMDFLAGGKGIGLGKVAELQKCVEVNPEWKLKAATIELNGTDLGTLLAQIQQRLTNGGL